jgi:hypothetical protein
MKKIFLLLILLTAGFMIMTGQKQPDKPQKWSIDPISSAMYDASQTMGAPLPMGDNYVNPNTTVRMVYTPIGSFAVNPNFRPLPRSQTTPPGYQSEVVITRHPTNQNIMFGSSNSFNNGGTLFISEGVYVTTNGGLNWFGSDTVQGAPVNNHGGDPGPTIDKDGNFIMTHLGYTVGGMYANYSTNNGLTWSSSATIQAGSVDKNLAGTDDAPSSPFYGRSYCVWTQFSGSYPAMCSYTTNGGASWSAPIQMHTPDASTIARGTDVRVGPNGEVYAIWARCGSGSSPENGLSFAKSTNGGANWTFNNSVVPMSGLLVFGTGFAPYGIRMNSFPRIDVDRSGGPRNGWIYVCASQKNLAPAGSDADIVLWKSTNGGTTWSSGVRVNQDPLNNGKLQFYNAVRVDENGGVNVVYYSNANTAADSAEVIVARSVDGGNTFTEIVASDHRFKPKSITTPGIASGYAGDYIGITSGNNKIWPLWMEDVSSGIFQAWTTSIDLGPAIVHTPLGNTEQTTGTRAINAQVIPAGSGIVTARTKVYYSKNSAGITDSIQMTNSGGNNWTASLPLTGAGTYRYYIRSQDSLGRSVVNPPTAPGTPYIFVAAADITPPVITHTALSNVAKPSWPAQVSATVTDNLGVDSVWVRWYVNNPTTTKQFKLISSDLTNFSALFNSVNGDVNIGDSVFYRIYAQDISAAHNRDSSAQYKFKIINVFLCEGFSNPAFPPANWSITATGTVYWTYNSVSSYGIGAGSAKFDFWSASSGTTQSLNSLTFGNTIANDTLRFDEAYAPYTSGTDSLIVETSTNGGSVFTRLVPLWGNAAGGPLNTTTTQTTAFTPTSTQWATKKYALPVGTNQVRFTAKSGFGNNLYVDSICVKSTALGVQNIFTGIPTRYKLDQNYPNPFNPVTKINFALPKQGLVTLKIYDLVGREVATLINEVRNAGYYTADFNGLNFASGVYFYKLTADDFIDTKRMVLIK